MFLGALCSTVFRCRDVTAAQIEGGSPEVRQQYGVADGDAAAQHWFLPSGETANRMTHRSVSPVSFSRGPPSAGCLQMFMHSAVTNSSVQPSGVHPTLVKPAETLRSVSA